MSAFKNALVLIVLLSTLSLVLNSTTHIRNRKAYQNLKWFQFAKGALEELGNGVMYDDCLPDSWVNTAVTDDEGPLEKGFQGLNSDIQKIITDLGSSVNTACKKRDVLESFLMGKIKGASSVFLETSSTGIFSKVKKVASSVAKSVDKAIDSVSNSAKDTYNDVKDLPDTLKNSFIDIRVRIAEWKTKFLAIFGKRIFDPVYYWIDCYQRAKKASNEIIETLQKFMNKVSVIMNAAVSGGLTDTIDLIELIVDLICNWEQFVKAGSWLAKAVNENTTAVKYGYLGKFTGRFIYAIGSAK